MPRDPYAYENVRTTTEGLLYRCGSGPRPTSQAKPPVKDARRADGHRGRDSPDLNRYTATASRRAPLPEPRRVPTNGVMSGTRETDPFRKEADAFRRSVSNLLRRTSDSKPSRPAEEMNRPRFSDQRARQDSRDREAGPSDGRERSNLERRAPLPSTRIVPPPTSYRVPLASARRERSPLNKRESFTPRQTRGVETARDSRPSVSRSASTSRQNVTSTSSRPDGYKGLYPAAHQRYLTSGKTIAPFHDTDTLYPDDSVSRAALPQQSRQIPVQQRYYGNETPSGQTYPQRSAAQQSSSRENDPTDSTRKYQRQTSSRPGRSTEQTSRPTNPPPNRFATYWQSSSTPDRGLKETDPGQRSRSSYQAERKPTTGTSRGRNRAMPSSDPRVSQNDTYPPDPRLAR